MATKVNKTKILSEMFELVVILNDIKQTARWTRLSPTTREAYLIIEDMWRAMAEAVRNDGGTVFELVTYQQMTLDGAFFEMADRMTPMEPDELPPDHEAYSLSNPPG